jgi:transcriptional regulator with XRE-family HTH domain
MRAGSATISNGSPANSPQRARAPRGLERASARSVATCRRQPSTRVLRFRSCSSPVDDSGLAPRRWPSDGVEVAARVRRHTSGVSTERVMWGRAAMARPLLRGDRLQAAREAVGLTREELATKLELSSPARVRVWETGLERPRPRFVPRLAAALGVDPLYLLDVDAGDPPLAALRLAAGFATNQVTAPGLSIMTYVRLEALSLCSDITAADGRSATSSSSPVPPDAARRRAPATGKPPACRCRPGGSTSARKILSRAASRKVCGTWQRPHGRPCPRYSCWRRCGRGSRTSGDSSPACRPRTVASDAT